MNMLKSMTGYGKGEASAVGGTVTVEIRTVNHRYGEVSVRMPRSLYAWENEVKRLVSAVLKRGKIDVSVQCEESSGADSLPQLDLAVARGYYEAFSRLAKELNAPQDVPVAFVMSQKGVMKDVAGVADETELHSRLMSAAQSAVDAVDSMRSLEGKALAADLLARRRQVAGWVDQIERRAPQVVLDYRQKLKARLDQLLDGVAMDDGRLTQEVALLADRCDITEELVRLASHFRQFDDALLLVEPVGRKLDFLIQEMNREINTIGSKSNDAGITTLVVQIKAEMEKMREQVQNVE
jgi:uncharacterized protein (TIGR00255 family)